MSGHSKWHRIKRQKAKEDQKRGKLFSKLARKITVAARKGGDPDKNLDLKHAIEEAKSNDVPKDNIERAIQRGTGELPGVELFETVYEGYGPGGVALFIDCVTDNKNRTTAEIRHILEQYGGKLGSEGCVSYLFDRKGMITINKEKISEIKLYDAAIEAGAEDIKEEDDVFEVITSPRILHDITEDLRDSDIEVEDTEITYIPSTEISLEGKEAKKLLKLLSDLDEQDDVQKVYANFNIPDSVMAGMEV